MKKGPRTLVETFVIVGSDERVYFIWLRVVFYFVIVTFKLVNLYTVFSVHTILNCSFRMHWSV